MKEPIIRSRLNTEALWVLNNKKYDLQEIKLIVLGDSHLNTYGWNVDKKQYELDENGERYVRILDHIIQYHSDTLFIIHGGDAIGKGISQNSTEELIQNMKAFVHTTKNKLFLKNIPLFTTIGKTDFIKENNQMTPRLFQRYIGDLFNDIYIPATKVHFLNLPTHYWENVDPPYFDELDLDKIHKKVSQNRSIYYIIDFHAPLRLGKMKSDYTDLHLSLSSSETNKFFNTIDKNVLGIFNHHIHKGFNTEVDFKYTMDQKLKIHKIQYVLTGDAGNSESKDWPNYYVITINNRNENNPIISNIEPVKVNDL